MSKHEQNKEILDILPSLKEALKGQGVDVVSQASQRVVDSAERARNLFVELAAPKRIFSTIDQSTFAKIFDGEGQNSPSTPLENIFPLAEDLILFAVTLGPALCEKIEDLFKVHDYAVAGFLDAISSLAVENMIAMLESDFRKNHESSLSYSPGYCGWHISAQKKLLELLNPQRIGISLNASFLMTPMKSGTGVIVTGNRQIHYFENKFLFCEECRGKTCRSRIRAISES